MLQRYDGSDVSDAFSLSTTILLEWFIDGFTSVRLRYVRQRGDSSWQRTDYI